VGVVVSFVACGGPPPSAPSDLLGQKVELSLPSDSGDLVAIPIPGASSTVLDFWSPSCVPCRKTLPALYARKAEIESHGGRLVLVSVLSDSETTEMARNTLASWGVKAHFLIDRGGVSQSQAGVRDLPSTLVVDAQAKLRWVAPKGASDSDVVSALP
jgi:thiol-disulfide isomerase/thioredoxin